MTQTEISTETPKTLTTIVSVKELQFRTNGLGRMFPLIQFNHTKELDKLGVDAMVYDSVKRLGEDISKGARLRVEFNLDTMMPTVKQVIKKGLKPNTLPSHCISCGHQYFEHESEQYCSNYMCSARDRGFIYKMFRMVSPENKVDMISDFLNKFPTNNAVNSIGSLAEFHYIFRTLKNLNTQSRLSSWTKNHPENGEKLFELENKMNEFFHKTKLPRSWFWHICNFPRITEPVFAEIMNIDPKGFINGEVNEEYQALSKEARMYIDHNVDMIMWLIKFFDSYGEQTEWIVLKNLLAS